MNATEIRRIGLKAAAPEVKPEETILQAANEVLGYLPRSERLSREESRSGLALRLAEIEIETLNKADVMRYQCEQAAEQLLSDAFQDEMVGAMRHNSHPWQYMTVWQRTKIAEYHKPIPEFVLNKAVQIKKHIPEAILMIEELEFRLDPFLLVRIGDDYTGNWEYVEVWDEPKFEGRK